jgi:hypothetical protein
MAFSRTGTSGVSVTGSVDFVPQFKKNNTIEDIMIERIGDVGIKSLSFLVK